MIRTIYPVPMFAQIVATWRPAIPPITDEMGKSWRQPNPDNFVIDETHAMMSQRDFDQLAEYSTSYPSGVYPGKCWKAQQRVADPTAAWGWRFIDKWELRWFGLCDDPTKCSNNHREIIII